MLAIFDKSVAKSPEGLQTPNADTLLPQDGSLVQHFLDLHPSSVSLTLGAYASISYTSDKKNPLFPRLFGVVDDIYCLFHGHIENVAVLKQQYGLNKTANEVIIVIEAYRTLRDRGPYPVDKVVRDILGKFAFLVYDLSSKTTFVAADGDGSVRLFWGTNYDGNLVLSDDSEVVKKGCGNSFAPFPKGCFFTTCGGLRSFEHPLNEVKAMPIVDSSGQICGSNFKVDIDSKKETSIPRVGSAANWSEHY